MGESGVQMGSLGRSHVCACMRVSLWCSVGGSRRGRAKLASPHHHVLLSNSKEAKNSKFEPGLAGPCEGIFVKVRGWNILYLIVYELDL